MRRVLILTTDKNNAVRLRTMLEDFRIEFEIAIGEDTGRTILSGRFMNLIMIDASSLVGGTSWVFSFLKERRLKIPVLVIGADEHSLREVPPDPGLVHFLPPPVDCERLEKALEEVGALGSGASSLPPITRPFPVASTFDAVDDL